MWHKDAITDGELDALKRTAEYAWGNDTCYPRLAGNGGVGSGQCYVTARWLVERLGGTVGARRGHYAWLSPDRRFVIDLTGGHRGGVAYEENDGYEPFEVVDNVRTTRFIKRANNIFDGLDKLLRFSLDYAGDAYPAEEPQAQSDSEQFDNYWHDEPAAVQPQGLYQFIYANGQLEVSPNHSHDQLAEHAGVFPQEHTGPFACGHISLTNGKATWEVQANINLHSMFRILKDYCKQVGWTWGGMTDTEGQPVNDAFAPKKTAQEIAYVYADDHLYLGRTAHAELALNARADGDERPLGGILRILGSRVEVHPVHEGALQSLFEWAGDNSFKLFAGNDNVLKTIPDLEVNNNYTENPIQQDASPFFAPRKDEREPSGLYKCPACRQLFPDWHTYTKHRRDEEPWGDPQDDGQFPQVDSDSPYGDGAHFTEMRQEPGYGTVGGVTVMPVTSWKEASRVDGFHRYAKVFSYANDDHIFYVAYRHGSPLGYAAVKPDGEIRMVHSAVDNRGIGTAIFYKLAQQFDSLYTHAAHEKTASLLKRYGWVQAKGQLWKWAKGKQPKDMLDAAVPFIYDVDEDKVHVGHPGARTSDIPGQFTPGGIVEGTYEPGGKVILRSLTTTPYTVRHLVELWYYSHPELEVKSVHLQDDAGKDTRLAATNVGATVQASATADPAVFRAWKALEAAGGRVFAVGGAVRDAYMGQDPKDVDLMVTGLPAEEVKQVLKKLPGSVAGSGELRDKPVDEGNAFGVFHYREGGSDGDAVEIALPRSDRSTGPRHEDFDTQMDHTMKPEDDLYRRDFTANAMAVDLANGRVLDPFGGAADIASHTLRTLHDKSLSDDPLRILRALVAHARHGLNPDEATRAQMKANAQGLTHLPANRILHELDKLMTAPNPANAIRLAQDTGVLKHFLPEVADAFGYDQNNPHHELELGEHLVNVLDRASEQTQDPDLRLAALLHDIGKPGSAWTDPETGSNHYYKHVLDDGTVLGDDHEDLGAKMAAERLTALRYPTKRVERIRDLIQHHMWPAFSSTRGARRFLNKVGPHADDLMTLRWADQGGKSAYPTDPSLNLDTQRNLIEHVRNAGEATDKSNLAINGNDLIALGIPQGPIMGQILNHLTEMVLDDPEMNTKPALLSAAENYARLPGS